MHACVSNVSVSNDILINASTVSEVLNENGDLIQSRLEKATNEALDQYSADLLNYDDCNEDNCSSINKKIVNHILCNTERTPEGRLIMPLPWNPECKHLLGQNYNLSKKILKSNFNKLKKNDHLMLYDQVFKEQEQLGIIERIEDIDSFMDSNPDCSFLPHMGIFKLKNETTKVRIVYLSNLCEKDFDHPNAVSHNNALLPGPCLNSKLFTALLLSRFDSNMLIFDITKAFLGIQLNECDQNKLMCLWYRNVDKGDYSLIAYRNLRLSFGLRPSPTILMLALYKMFILDNENDDHETIELKKLIYNCMYMDNGLISSNDSDTLSRNYEKLPSLFNEYMFDLQQFATNNCALQGKIDADKMTKTDSVVKFFGMQWDRINDTLNPFPINFDVNACTKRMILSSLNSVYDLFNVYGPMINRAKLFFQRLQIDKSLEWDTVIPVDLQNEWVKIVKQANSTPTINVKRCIGSRDSSYSLVAFSDASSAIYGVVVYILDNQTGDISFLCAKNKVVSTKLNNKSIPSLEMQGVCLATDLLIDLYDQLTGDKLVLKINVTNLVVYTDSMVCLSWIKSYFINYDKMQKRSVFVMNRLKQIGDNCEKFPVLFRYIEGRDNPGDYISRPVSYNKLSKTDYFEGPKFLKTMKEQPDIEVSVPNVISINLPHESNLTDTTCTNVFTSGTGDKIVKISEHLIPLEKYSSLQKTSSVLSYVHKFIHNVRERIRARKCNDVVTGEGVNFHNLAIDTIIKTEQSIHFSDIIDFFENRNIVVNRIPNLVTQLNLYVDDRNIIRVKSKFNNLSHPILLPYNSRLTELIVNNVHIQFSHAGIYTVLREIRKEFWILRGFSTVRSILKRCIACRKINQSPIKVNQNSYRNFRSDPPRIPFSYIFIDYIGPFVVDFEGKSKKIYLLIITCLWTRAVSLIMCLSADTNDFLRGLQSHIYSHGMFQMCLSDMGSQITSGTKIISNFLNDMESKEFFQRNGITSLDFHHYAKGNSSLGSVVESCVKQVKNLINKSIGKQKLILSDFMLLISKTNHVINRRPVAFKEYLRNSVEEIDYPGAITPEMLLHGRELISYNIIPQLQPDFFQDFQPDGRELRDSFRKLSDSCSRLRDIYHNEFIVNLTVQATDRLHRYKPVMHQKLNVGDLVLLVEPHAKQSNYPMGIVRKVTENSLGEVTSAMVFKGATREEVHRHSTSLIKILDCECLSEESTSSVSNEDIPKVADRPQRAAAKAAKNNISSFYKSDYV